MLVGDENEDITQAIYHEFFEDIRRLDEEESLEMSESHIGRINYIFNRYLENVDVKWTDRLRNQFGTTAKTNLRKLDKAFQKLLRLWKEAEENGYVNVEWTDRLRNQFGTTAKTNLRKLDKAFQKLLRLWKEAEENGYVRGVLIDAYCGAPKVHVPEYDNCIEELSAFGVQLECVTKAIHVKVDLPLDCAPRVDVAESDNGNEKLSAFGEQLKNVSQAVHVAMDMPLDRGALPVFKPGGQADKHFQELLEGLGRIAREILTNNRERYRSDIVVRNSEEEFYSILQDLLFLINIELEIKSLRNRLPLDR